MKKVLKPSKEWGPRKAEHKEEYLKSLQYGESSPSGYVLALTEDNNVVNRNGADIPEQKTLLV